MDISIGDRRTCARPLQLGLGRARGRPQVGKLPGQPCRHQRQHAVEARRGDRQSARHQLAPCHEPVDGDGQDNVAQDEHLRRDLAVDQPQPVERLHRLLLAYLLDDRLHPRVAVDLTRAPARLPSRMRKPRVSCANRHSSGSSSPAARPRRRTAPAPCPRRRDGRCRPCRRCREGGLLPPDDDDRGVILVSVGPAQRPEVDHVEAGDLAQAA